MNLKTTRAQLYKFSSKKRAQQAQRFFKTGKGQYGEGDQFIGVSVPDIRKIAKAAQDISSSEIQELVRSPIHEERLLGFIICSMQYHKARKINDERTEQKLVRFFLKNKKYLNNWDIIDVTVPKLLGPYFLERDRSILHKLIKSKNLWDRRIALMTTFEFVRNADFRNTLEFCELVLNDKEDLIHKASGWMLREIGKRDKKLLLEFLAKHRLSMPRTMLRYSIEKLTPTERAKLLMKSQ